jgi:hypothetical protein
MRSVGQSARKRLRQMAEIIAARGAKSTIIDLSGCENEVASFLIIMQK